MYENNENHTFERTFLQLTSQVDGRKKRNKRGVLGNRKLVLCRELTKKFEEFIRGTIDEAQEWAFENEIRGEFCLIIEGTDFAEEQAEEVWWQSIELVEHAQYYIDEKQLSSEDAIKQTATDRGLQKRDVYHAYHVNG